MCIRKLLFLSIIFVSTIKMVTAQYNAIPYSTDSTFLTIWNGESYIPIALKGINLGVALPGKHPGELEVTKQQYAAWFTQIKNAGFNTIRLYTLHFPHFYQVLDSFNTANIQNPLLFIQGIWMEEDIPSYNHDLYQLTQVFKQEIEDNIDCVHGNKTIPPRLGKAYGNYQTDASKWCLAYIIGRETFPIEVLKTNQTHEADSIFSGQHLSIKGSASETWITEKLNHTISYENTHYHTQRPVSFSSWPTLDPLHHPAEPNREEDTASINLNKIVLTNAPAGVFISYHAYPYYPDFISEESSYQLYADQYGLNSYLGYLNALKAHYPKMPLIIAETGVPSSWGIAHYSSNGMHHGGFDQLEQGITNLRLIGNTLESNCGGVILFSWLDEWFKRTWITDPMDYLPDRRILWHNVTAAEQNFGLIGFKKQLQWHNWQAFQPASPIKKAYISSDFDYLHLALKLDNQFQPLDEMWLGIDTYADTLGESILPNGDTTLCKSEFALKINNYEAKLFVTEAYDLFGIWHQISPPVQLYHSIDTTGGNWNIVRWKNNSPAESIQYIGNLKVNRYFLPESTNDAVTIYKDSILIRLPWTLLQFVDPSKMRVIHDFRNTTQKEDTISEGVQVCFHYKGIKHLPANRYIWSYWNEALSAQAYEKTSYNIVKEGLEQFNNPAIAVVDSFYSDTIFPFSVNATEGLLTNDYDLDGSTMNALLYSNAQHGLINVFSNGSFSYVPVENFNGWDSFKYVIFDGKSLSEPVNVYLKVNSNANIKDNKTIETLTNLMIYPNPAKGKFTIQSNSAIQSLQIVDNTGKILLQEKPNKNATTIDGSKLANGTYLVMVDLQNNKRLIQILNMQK